MPQLFFTDILFLLLVITMAGLFYRMSHVEYFRRPWHKVSTNRTAMVSLVILLAYATIALLDSIRFLPDQNQGTPQQSSYTSEPLSLLDSWLGLIRLQVEKTYSAPLSSYSYNKEIIQLNNGGEQWAYPRLQYGGAHLKNPVTEKYENLALITLKGLATGFFAWIILTLVLGLALIRPLTGDNLKTILQGQSEIPWRAMALTLLALCLAAGIIAKLGVQYHLLGTDKVGTDVLYQSLKSVRTGLLIGTLTTFATLPLALLFGITAGYFRGWVDDVIQYIYTTLNSIPGVLLIAASMLIMQTYMANHESDFASLELRADFRLLALCLILGLTSWTGLCRLLRAETLKLREMEYIQAAKVLGVSQPLILIRHILPNLFHLVLISTALDFSSLVLAEAVLSYINIGVDPSMNSWGNMINSARLEIARDPIVWWSLASAFLFMLGLVLPANLLADALRDAFDPLRGE